MNILYIERNLAKDSIVFDQIQRIGEYASVHTMAVQIGRFPRLEHPDVTSVRSPFFPKIERMKGRLFVRSALRAYRGLASRESFDLVHAHLAYPEGLAALRIGQKYGLPIVITLRGSEVLLYPQQSNYLRRTVSEVLSNAAALIGVSSHLCRKACALGADEQRCHHIPDGIGEAFLVNEPNGTSGNAHDLRIVLFAGDFLPVKNVTRMIEAFAAVAVRRPDVMFHFAGRGPLRGNMEKLIGKSGFSDRARFLGQLPYVELAAQMRSADLLCLPSVSEGWGNVIAEAMACGTPVVGADVDAIPEQIVSEEFGLLCDPYSPEDIAEKILRALDMEWDHAKIAERGRAYTREGTARQIVEVYADVLRTHSRTRE